MVFTRTSDAVILIERLGARGLRAEEGFRQRSCEA